MDKLKIEGNKLKDNKKRMVLRGASIPEPFEIRENRNYDFETILEDMKSRGFNSVRIPLHPGRYASINNYLEKLIKPVVDFSEELNLYCVIDWHAIGNPLKDQTRRKSEFVFKEGEKHLLHDVSLDLAFSAWKEISEIFGKNKHVLFEVFNEPAPGEEPLKEMDLEPLRWEEWKNVLNKFLDVIRANSDNIVIFSPNNWAFNLEKTANDPLQGENIVYSVHPYPIHNNWKDNFRKAEDLPLIVTEWGFRRETKEKFMRGSIQNYGKKLLKYMNEEKISWFAWCYDDIWSPRIFEKGKYKQGELTEWGEFLLRNLR